MAVVIGVRPLRRPARPLQRTRRRFFGFGAAKYVEPVLSGRTRRRRAASQTPHRHQMILTNCAAYVPHWPTTRRDV